MLGFYFYYTYVRIYVNKKDAHDKVDVHLFFSCKDPYQIHTCSMCMMILLLPRYIKRWMEYSITTIEIILVCKKRMLSKSSQIIL